MSTTARAQTCTGTHCRVDSTEHVTLLPTMGRSDTGEGRKTARRTTTSVGYRNGSMVGVWCSPATVCLLSQIPKHVIIEKVGASLVRVLREQPIHGRVARAVHRGEAHAGASIAARHMLSDEEKDCYLRGMAGIHSCTMRQLYEMARKDDKEGMVARVLREAGPHRSMCPFCFFDPPVPGRTRLT